MPTEVWHGLPDSTHFYVGGGQDDTFMFLHRKERSLVEAEKNQSRWAINRVGNCDREETKIILCIP